MQLYNEISFPAFPKTEIGRKARFWYEILYNKVISLREWKNLPKSINRDYLETVLMNRGYIIWIKDNEGELRSLYGAAYGFDCYNFPTSAEISNTVLGNLKGVFGVNCVFMRNNTYSQPVQKYLFEYAMQLAQLDTNLKINLDNLKTTTVFNVSNQEQAKQVKELYKKIVNGEPAVISTDNLNFLSDNKVDVFSQNIQYLGSQFLADRRTIINDFLSLFGINNLALEKKERLVTGEIEYNNQETSINRAFWLRPAQDAVKEINEMFGTNIEVDYIEDNIEDDLMKTNVEESDDNVD